MLPVKRRCGSSMKDMEIHGESNVWGVQLKDRKRAKDFMLILVLNKTIHQLTMTNSVHWHGHVLRSEDGHVLRKALDVEAGDHGRKKTWRRQVEEKIVTVGLRRQGALCLLA